MCLFNIVLGLLLSLFNHKSILINLILLNSHGTNAQGNAPGNSSFARICRWLHSLRQKIQAPCGYCQVTFDTKLSSFSGSQIYRKGAAGSFHTQSDSAGSGKNTSSRWRVLCGEGRRRGSGSGEGGRGGKKREEKKEEGGRRKKRKTGVDKKLNTAK